ncbi:class I SAM-dependent methyltransferase [Brevundimonas vesicularis]|uniref:class I SAM-dependent methyltransferase n=1 Tax=Brevundimonas vesicularis TaxID=41276 RepID=UPI0038D4B677
MTTILYGRPPAVFDVPTAATQASPLIPGAASLEALEPGSVDEAMIYAPPGAIERRYTIALALRALKVGGRLDIMAAKDKGGSRLAKELKGFGLEFGETAKAHHRRCIVERPAAIDGLDAALKAGGPQIVPGLEAWSQPGIFAWDRVDPGTALLAQVLPPLKGAGADLGCGFGALSIVALRSKEITSLRLIDLDRRAIEAAHKNVDDPRARFEWADVRTLPTAGELNFVVSNPPFHDGGAEDRRLGQNFIRQAAALLKTGGVAWIVANRHLPYEAELNAAFKRVRMVADQGGYKIFEAIK